MTDTSTEMISGSVEAPPEPAGPTITYKLDVVNQLPISRWLMFRRRLELTSNEILADSALVMLVAAVECHRRATGSDDWPRYESLGLEQLGALFNINTDDQDAADKS